MYVQYVQTVFPGCIDVAITSSDSEALQEIITDDFSAINQKLLVSEKNIDSLYRLIKKIVYLSPELIIFSLFSKTAAQLNLEELAKGSFIDILRENSNVAIQLCIIAGLFSVVMLFKYIAASVSAKVAAKLREYFEFLVDKIIFDIEEFSKIFYWSILRKLQKQYCDYIGGTYNRFETPGISSSCTLRDTCVSLRVNVKGETKKDYVQALDRPVALGRNSSIWDFLALGRRRKNFRRIVLLGKPGSGKSTLLKSVAVAYAQRYHRQISIASKKSPYLIPIVLIAREISRDVLSQNKDLCQSVIDTLKYLEISKEARFQKWLEKSLKGGRCLVMIDGLDEIADELDRRRFNLWVDDVVKRYPKSFFLISARHFGYDENIFGDNNFIVLELQDLDLMDAEEFISRWYLNESLSFQAEQNLLQSIRSSQNTFWSLPLNILRTRKYTDGYYAAARQKSEILAGALTSKIRNTPSLSAMARNPLSLSMMVAIHSSENPLPESRPELYKAICDSLLNSKKNSDALSQVDQCEDDFALNKAQKFVILQKLALALMTTKTLDFLPKNFYKQISQEIIRFSGGQSIEVENFLKHIQDRTGLLIDADKGKKRFSHRCLQEFLAADHLRDLGQEDSRIEKFLLRQVNEYWWNETIRIYAATSSISESAVRIIHKSISKFKENPEKNTYAFKLAYDCYEDCQTLPERLKAFLANFLNKNLESKNPVIRKYAAKVKFLQRFANNFEVLDHYREIDRLNLTQCEYQVFVDTQIPSGKYYQPDYWYGSNFAESTSLEYVTILQPKDTDCFCEWLSEEQYDHANKGFLFRLPKLYELKKINTLKKKKLEEKFHGYWCKDGEKYAVVGADSTLITHVRNRLFDEIRQDLEESGRLKNKLQNIRLTATKLRELDGKSGNLDAFVEGLSNINIIPNTCRSISVDVTPFISLIRYIIQAQSILNKITISEMDGNLRLAREAKKSVDELRREIEVAHKVNREKYFSLYFSRVINLLEKVSEDQTYQDDKFLKEKAGRSRRSQKANILLEVIRSFASILINFSDDLSLNIDEQILSLESCINEARNYDGSNNVNLISKVFIDFKLDLKSVRKIVLKRHGLTQESVLHHLASLETTQYLEHFRYHMDRTLPHKVMANLSSILPFFSIAFSAWSKLEKEIRSSANNVRRSDSRTKLYKSYNLHELKDKKKRAVRAYVIALHVYLGLTGELPLFGGIKLVREKRKIPRAI